MEELANRTIDEIQACKFKCRGYLQIEWILDVYRSTKSRSMLRLCYATSLYHSRIKTFDREFQVHRLSNFKLVKNEFPEVVNNINYVAVVFRSKPTNGFKIVDYRDQKARICVFHLHQHSKVCHARSRIARIARTWGKG
jgi:predicted phosphohydrolase